MTTKTGTTCERFLPAPYHWIDPRHAVVYSSIVPCNADLLRGLRGEGAPETTGHDNLRTFRLVFAAYESSRARQTIPLS